MTEIRRFLRERVLWPAVCILPSLITMRGMFSTNDVFSYRDNIGMFWPLHLWFRRSVAAGEFPLWDPFVALGQSAIAEPTRHLFFPPILLLRLLPFEVLGYNLSIGLAFPLAALGMYLFLRTWLSKPASALGGIVFSTAMAMLSTASMPNLSWSVALAPWVVWMTAEFVIKGTGWRFALLAFLAALQVLAGDPVTLVPCLAVAGLHATFVCFRANRTYALRVAGAAAAMLTGFALSAVQLLPLFEAVPRSGRAGFGSGVATYWSLHPLRIFELVVPFPFGDAVHLPVQYAPWFGTLNSGREPFLVSVYVGLLFVFLAMIGLASSDWRRRIFWAAVVVVATVMALGGFTPVYTSLLEAVPSLKAFRFPEKYFLVALIGGSVFVAEGWEALLMGRITRKHAALALTAVAAFFGIVIAGCFASYAIASWMGVDQEGGRQFYYELLASLVPLGAMGIACAIVAGVVTRQSTWKDVALSVFFGLVALDLVLTGAFINPVVSRDLVQPQPWVAHTVASGARAFVGHRLVQIFDRSMPDDPDAFDPMIHAPLDSECSVGEAIYTSRIAIFPSQWGMREVLTNDVPVLWPKEYVLFTHLFLEADTPRRVLALQRLGVRTQVVKHKPLGPYSDAQPIENIAPIAAYYSDEPFNRAFVASSSIVESSPLDSIGAIFSPDFDFAGTAIVDREAQPAGIAGEPVAPSATILEDRSNRITIEATAGQGAALVLLDSYNPGWRATVDGVSAEVVRADGLFLGVRIPPGRHTIALRFLPASFVYGAWISAVTLVVLLLMAAVSLVRRRRAEV